VCVCVLNSDAVNVNFSSLLIHCCLVCQLQDTSLIHDKELQRLDVLESEADQRFVCLFIVMYTLL